MGIVPSQPDPTARINAANTFKGKTPLKLSDETSKSKLVARVSGSKEQVLQNAPKTQEQIQGPQQLKEGDRPPPPCHATPFSKGYFVFEMKLISKKSSSFQPTFNPIERNFYEIHVSAKTIFRDLQSILCIFMFLKIYM